MQPRDRPLTRRQRTPKSPTRHRARIPQDRRLARNTDTHKEGELERRTKSLGLGAVGLRLETGCRIIEAHQALDD